MANKHLAIKVAALTIGAHGRSEAVQVRNRFLFQLLHPKRHNENPAVSFAVGPGTGPVAPADLDGALADGIVYKGQPFEQLFDEKVRVRIHHFQDVTADWLQVAAGKVFGSALGSLLGKVKLISISLGSLIDPAESLQLGEDAYSQKLGYFELVLDPNADRPAGGETMTVELVAEADIYGLAPLGPAGRPRRIKIVSRGQVTATMELQIRLF